MKTILKKYWDAGLATLPVKPDKSPTTKWKGGVTDIAKYTYGIGIVCGAASGGLECLDFDNHFGDAKERLSLFVGAIKDIYDKGLVVQSTQNGGFHLLFRCEYNEGNLKLASRAKHVGGKFVPDAIIETRGEGGYFVAAPTVGYRIVRNDLLAIPVITKAERAKIFEVAKSFNEWHELHREANEERGRVGDRYNKEAGAIEDAKNELERAGWYELGNNQWRRPNKKDGISATFGKVAENVFYVFTANGYPFEPNKGYTPFQILSLLKYNGNFKEFARVLGERYNAERDLPRGERPKKSADKDELLEELNGCYIDLSIPVEKPPVIMKIRDFENGAIWEKRLFTLGNFSAITGKSKSKKTFLVSYLTAAAIENGLFRSKIVTDIPPSKNDILYFDTEQSKYDAYTVAKRVERMLGYTPENFFPFYLREKSAQKRVELIDFALEKFAQNVSLTIIDGIADLSAKGVNDEEEAAQVVGLLMRWTSKYNIHIINVIHQNKNDNYATGHLGSAVLKKAEVIIGAEKDSDDVKKSVISCQNMRGAAEFADFVLEISSDGLPIVDDLTNTASFYEVKEFDF